jgi:hypothetical protein
MKRRRAESLLRGAVIASVLICVGLLTRTQIRAYIAAAVVDLGYRLLRLPQIVLWVAPLLLVGAIVAFALFRAWGVRDVPAEEPQPTTGEGAVAPLARWIQRSPRSPFARACLIHELSELAAQLIVTTEPITRRQARVRVQTGEWTSDSVVRSFLCHRDADLPGRQFEPRFEYSLSVLERVSEEV